MEPSHVDLMIRIGAAPPGGGPYPVEAVVDGQAHFFGGQLVLRRDALREQTLDMAAYGNLLAESLFSPPIQRAYDQAQARAEDQYEGRLRLRLAIDPDASELQSMRWERLVVRHLGQSIPAAIAMATPFSRYTALEEPAPPPLSERPIQMLVAVANPSGLDRWSLAPVDVARELSNLWETMAPLADPATLAITLMPGCSGLPADLRTRLCSAGVQILDGPTGLDPLSAGVGRFHIVHLIAHGAHRPGPQGSAGSTRLLLEAPDGSPDLVADDELVGRWAGADPLPRLIYLAACDSATRDEDATAPFTGLAPRLVAAGIPAVVAMQDQVPMDYSAGLTRRFFASLLANGVVDQALNEARWGLYQARSPDWSIPVLYMRLESGRLLVDDPLRAALQAMAEWSRTSLALREPPLPIEVAQAPADADAATLGQLERVDEAGHEIVQAVQALLLAAEPRVQPFVLLVGGEGAGKALHLRLLVRQAAEASLGSGGQTFVPVLLDLTEGAGDISGPAISDGVGLTRLLLAALERFWPGLTAWRLQGLWDADSGPIFAVAVYNIHVLAESERAALLRELADLARRNRRHRFLVVCDPTWLGQGLASDLPVSDYLVVKPLSFQRVANYLRDLPDPAAGQLQEALEQRRLFDLAAMPWLLLHMLGRCRLGDPPRSRSKVLAGYIGAALANIPAGGAVRSRARDSLGAFAQAMQLARCRVLPLDRALEILDSVRGRREYRLVEMLDGLLKTKLLTRSGQDAIQFSYPALQSYACAEALLGAADLDLLLDDITATLGRLSRLHWWGDTLVLLAGMTDDIDTLVELILYGAGAGQEERVFLAARCIEENGGETLDPRLREQVVTSLLHLANADYESRTRVRITAIRAIGRLQEASAIPHLVRIALDPTRTNWVGKRVVEYSGVRLAAIDALRSMGEATFTHVGTELPMLTALFRRWIEADVSAIADALSHPDARFRPIAAFLLGLLRTPEAAQCLIERFIQPDQDQVLSWALADALTLVDPVQVIEQAILPFIDPETGAPRDLAGESKRPARDRRRQLAYLIGKVKPRGEWARAYLAHCMHGLTDVALKGRVIQAYGDLLDLDQRPLLERIAAGGFSEISSDAEWSDEDRAWLRSVALETLAKIGDLGTTRRIHAGLAPGEEWPHALELALFRTGEEITSRAWNTELADNARRRAPKRR